MSSFPPAPTYASPVEIDATSGRSTFSPLWLQWFLDAARYFTSLGAGGSGVDHEGLAFLQGGVPGEYFHLSNAEHTAVAGARILKGTQAADDLVITDTLKGLVLKDAQGMPHYWRITISTTGTLVITDLGTTPP